MVEDKQKSSVNVDLGASMKAEVKTEIPTESSGRLLDALTDIIRPFSESRGLRADQIRLQREDVLIEIAKRAKHRLATEGRIEKPVPNKFLIPFLEKASCENEEDLLQIWSNLLASESKASSSSNIMIVDALAKMTSEEAKLLSDLCSRTGFEKKSLQANHEVETAFETDEDEYDQPSIEAQVAEFQFAEWSHLFFQELDKSIRLELDAGKLPSILTLVPMLEISKPSVADVQCQIGGPACRIRLSQAYINSYSRRAWDNLLMLGLITPLKNTREVFIEVDGRRKSQIVAVEALFPSAFGFYLIRTCED